MLLRKSGIAGVLICLAYACLCQETPKATSINSFRIDDSRPYIYLLFDHEGAGIRRSENEPKLRFWFRLVNNCRVPIAVSTFGVPKGSPPEEVGVMYDVAMNAHFDGAVSGISLQTSDSAVAQDKNGVEMPHGYMFDVGSSTSIAPGASILFSVPVNHLGHRWHIEIPYSFDLKDARTPRPSKVGGEPVMRLEYDVRYLPEEVQKALSSK